MRRSGLSSLALALALLRPAFGAAGNPPKALRAPKVLPGAAVEIKTADGWTLAARYSPPKENQYVFVLLHGAGGRKEDWFYLDKAMARRGLGVLALDLRGHGASQGAPPGQPSHWRLFKAAKEQNDWADMVHDVEAAVDYLKGAGVAESSIALGGGDVGSSIALKYAAVHPQVPFIFLLSPGMAYREVLTVNAMRAYTKRPILMVVGNDDRRSLNETAILFEFAKRSVGAENAALINVDREHGAKMVNVNKGLIAQILDWVDNPVKTPGLQSSTDVAPGAMDAPAEDERLGAPPGDSQDRTDPARR